MPQIYAHSVLLTTVLLLSACSRDVVVSTDLPDSGDLRPGDGVFLAERRLGTVRAIKATDQPPRAAVEIGLAPEHAALVQSNAVAYLALEGPPSLVLMNPTAAANPVAPGDRLRGLTPLEATIWRAGTAAEAVSGIVDQVSSKIVDYLQSDEWAQTQAEIDAEIARLASDSRQAAQSVVDELQALFDTINDRAADGAQKLADELTAIEAEINRLEAEGHDRLADALRRLRERIEALGPAERERQPIEA